MTKSTNDKDQVRLYLFGRGRCVAAADKDVKPFTDHVTTWLRIHRCVTLRTWGTTDGIGELASLGVRNGTVLDPVACIIDVPVEALHERVKCSDQSSVMFNKAIDEREKDILKK
jgi:hypothetical protein